MSDDDPRWGDPRDRDDDAREIEATGSSWDADLRSIARTRIFANARMTHASATVTRIIVTTIPETCFSMVANSRAGLNERSFWTVITATSSTATRAARNRRPRHTRPSDQ